jgi:hypothetical protein
MADTDFEPKVGGLCMDAAPHPAISQRTLELAMDYLYEELDKVQCLAILLCKELEPKKLNDSEYFQNVTAWRLAQLIEERFESTDFQNSIRELLRVKPVNSA